MANWSFRCTCQLCQKSEANQCPCESCGCQSGLDESTKVWVDPREALYCGRDDCRGWLYMCPKTKNGVGLCTECKQPSAFTKGTVAKTLSEGLKLLDKLRDMNAISDFQEIQDVSAPVMKKLSAIQPPCAHPFFELLGIVDVALQLQSQYPARQLDMIEEAMYFKLVSLSAIRAGGEDRMIPEGHLSEVQHLVRFANDYLKYQMFRKENPEVAARARPKTSSQFLRDVPLLPPKDQRIQAGLAVMTEALEKIEILYGREEQGGIPGLEMRKLMNVYRYGF